MEILTRGEVEADLAPFIRCFEVIRGGDSLTVRGWTGAHRYQFLALPMNWWW